MISRRTKYAWRLRGLAEASAREGAVLGEIREAGVAAVELEFDAVGRAVTMLLHQHLGLAGGAVELLRPLHVVGRTGLGLPGREIILFAIDEHHDVGVLFERAGLAKVGEDGTLVVAGVDATAELRKRHDRNIEVLGED